MNVIAIPTNRDIVRDDRADLIFASMEGNKDIVEFLIEKGADVNQKDNDGNTALIVASEGGYEEIVELLIQNDITLSISDVYGIINNIDDTITS